MYKKAYEEKRWVDVPDQELQQYGELFEQAVELLVTNRERIRATQEAVNIPVEITGIAASAVLSAELGRLMTSLGRRPVQKPTPGAVPVTPVPARGPAPLPPMPAPAPGTRVPAPPPPASKPPFRKAA